MWHLVKPHQTAREIIISELVRLSRTNYQLKCQKSHEGSSRRHEGRDQDLFDTNNSLYKLLQRIGPCEESLQAIANMKFPVTNISDKSRPVHGWTCFQLGLSRGFSPANIAETNGLLLTLLNLHCLPSSLTDQNSYKECLQIGRR